MFPFIIVLEVLCILSSQVSGSFYSSGSGIVELTSNNFDKLVINSEQVWLVEFFAPWCKHCQALAPEYTKAARALDGVANVGAIDVEQHKELASRYGVDGFPRIKIFGLDKENPGDFNGDRKAEDLVDAAISATKTGTKMMLKKRSSNSVPSVGDVVELSDSNFGRLVENSKDMWMVNFYAPWCKHCQHLAPQWANAASELKGKVAFGALDATVHTDIASHYDIKGYPSIKFLYGNSVEEYDGKRTAGDIVQWAQVQAYDHGPGPQVEQVVDQNSFKRACEENSLCVIAFLPNIRDCQTDCRNDYISMVEKAGQRFKRWMWGWGWADSGAQKELEEALGIGGYGYPALAVINPRRMRYSTFRGSFSSEGIEEFLTGISQGRSQHGALVPTLTFPKMATTAAWDGNDYVSDSDEYVYEGNNPGKDEL